MENQRFELNIEIGEIDGVTGMSCKVIGDMKCLDQAIRSAVRYAVENSEDSEKNGNNQTALLFQKISESYAEALYELINQGYEKKLDKQFSFIAKSLAKSYKKLNNDKNRK